MVCFPFLHVVHNTFHAGIESLGQEVEQLAFDLHAWFKNAPCKEEDFQKLSENTNIVDESLILRHVSTRWLTLAPTLERILVRWADAIRYFIQYLPQQKEYKKTLPNNRRYSRIVKALKDNEKETLVEIKFLVGIAPIFTKYLTMFQSEGPLVHCIFGQMKVVLITILKRFMKPDAVDSCKFAKDLKSRDVSDISKHLPL